MPPTSNKHGHSLGYMEDVMDITYLLRLKEDTFVHSKYTIYIKKLKKGVQINDKSTITKNRIFDVIFTRLRKTVRYRLQAFATETPPARRKPRRLRDVRHHFNFNQHMPCSTVYSLSKSTRSSAYFTVRISCPHISRSPIPSWSTRCMYLSTEKRQIWRLKCSITRI
jgi:hypothetical protein